MPSPCGSRPTVAPLAAALFAAVLVAPVPARAQDGEPTDSAALVEEARERQASFEQFRQSRIPVERERTDGQCDEQIGRMCIWFGGEEEERFPPEPDETTRARRGLIGVLLETRERVSDAWVTGQLVHYLVEEGDFRYAERIARECGIEAEWWCAALLGYGFHVRGAVIQAEEAFREALALMPDEERRRWQGLRYVVHRDQAEAFDRLDAAERERRWELFWRLSDPLVLVPGNDRLTEHFARLVVARNRSDAENPHLLPWDEDLEETLVRYGRNTGYSRTHSPGFAPLSGGFRLQDTRRVVGHHDPMSRGYLFPERFIESPPDIPPESWITAPREARTWYAPPYAPDFRALETQVGRFRRGEEMLVVGAYRPTASVATGDVAGDPVWRTDGPVEAALFLVGEDGRIADEERRTDAAGVFTLRTFPGRYVASLEVLDREGSRAWRARQGVTQVPLTPGLVGVSDLLLLDEDAPVPGSLEEALPHVRPGVRLTRGERFTMVWEVYGLRVQEPVRVTIGFTRGRPGFLARVGDFLGVIEPEQPVEITFTETGPDQVQTAFRALTLDLPDVDPGEYTLHLRLDLAGREPVIASRPIVVEG